MHKIAALTALAAGLLTGCKKGGYLEYGSPIDGTVSQEEIFRSDRHARGFLNDAYLGLGTGTFRFVLNGELGLSAGTDEAVSGNLVSSINTLTNGSWSAVRTYDENYSNQYANLRRANLFLENAPLSAITPTNEIPDLMGQAYFLRAFFHFELMRRYGSITLATRSFAPDEDLNLPRNSFDETVASIVRDCDSAAANIVAATLSDQVTAVRGRATKAAALALKSRTLLYAASPLNNPSDDPAKWQAAADAAKAMIDLSGTKHALLAAAAYPNLWNYGVTASIFNAEVILSAQTAVDNTIDQLNSPPSYDGASGRTNPTQELVDAFEMKTTGRPITDAASGYSAAAPYAGRDDRLQIFINYHYNPRNWRGTPVDVRDGAKDNNPLLDAGRTTRTGYYLRKYLSETSRYGAGGATNTRRAWVFFRYAEILLNYAEALNEAQGPTAEVLAAVNRVRTRVGLANLQTTNATGNGYVAPTKDDMRLRIQNERRVELCFEDHRFFDVRRWNKGAEFFNKPVSGMRITGASPTTGLTYTRFQVENRVFTPNMNRFPFPQQQIIINPRLQQNPGW